MIYKKDSYEEKLKLLNKSNFDIVMDFDRTITAEGSVLSWGVLNGRGILPKEYDYERNDLYRFYRPIEKDTEVDEVVKMVAMEDWLSKHLELFKKYQLNKDQIIDLFSENDIMNFRNGFLDFFKYIDYNNIKLKLLSAGVGDFFLKFLEVNGCSFVNLEVTSNFLNFDRNGVVIGFKDRIIHALNKSHFAFKKEDKDFVLLVGDQESDIMMVNGYDKDHIISVAFIDKDNIDELESFKDVYDLVLTGEEGFNILLKDLKRVLDN